jgi:hypothetical protein
MWPRHADLLPRPHEGAAGLHRPNEVRGPARPGGPARQAVRALLGLVSAGAMRDVTGIDFEEFVGPVERN